VIDIIHGAVTIGGVEYPTQTEIELPDTKEQKDDVRPGVPLGP